MSGSICDADIEKFTGVLTGLAKNVSFTFYNFDHRVDDNSKQQWRKGKKAVKLVRTIAGGTCINALQNHFRKNKDEYDGYIILTDGLAPKPNPCIKRRCWVLLPNYDLHFPADKTDVVVRME